MEMYLCVPLQTILKSPLKGKKFSFFLEFPEKRLDSFIWKVFYLYSVFKLYFQFFHI